MQESKRSRVKRASGKEMINREYPDQPVDIGSNLQPATRQALISLLKKHKHVFTWTPTDMIGVDREVIENKLMILPGTKEAKQKKGFKGETGIGQSMSKFLSKPMQEYCGKQFSQPGLQTPSW